MMRRSIGVATDLYELTMAAAYFEQGMTQRAVFELFIRSLPQNRSFLITAGLEQALEYLESLRFNADEIGYLKSHPAFENISGEFFEYLREFRFTGDVSAMAEGTAAVGMEPILRVEAPLIEAQVVETYLLSTITFQTLIATKAARINIAAGGKDIVDFGTRRAHGPEAGLLAARASYIGGCLGTSNVEAGLLFNIPTFGTLAHSFIMSFEAEEEAFRAFLASFPHSATLLVDTYDTINAVEMICEKFGGPESNIAAVRLDSGDLVDLSKRTRALLDAAGMTSTTIFASGDLNEEKIADLLARGAAIDAFGVGTELVTSYDSPALGGVYKLAATEVNGLAVPRMKLSGGKTTYPGAKQVWRLTNQHEEYERDIIALTSESEPDVGGLRPRPLLEPVMKDGRIQGSDSANPLIAARERAKGELARLPKPLLELDCKHGYPVMISSLLEKKRGELSEKLIANRM